MSDEEFDGEGDEGDEGNDQMDAVPAPDSVKVGSIMVTRQPGAANGIKKLITSATTAATGAYASGSNTGIGYGPCLWQRSLPLVIANMIFGFLPGRMLLSRIERVCRLWRVASRDHQCGWIYFDIFEWCGYNDDSRCIATASKYEHYFRRLAPRLQAKNILNVSVYQYEDNDESEFTAQFQNVRSVTIQSRWNDGSSGCQSLGRMIPLQSHGESTATTCALPFLERLVIDSEGAVQFPAHLQLPNLKHLTLSNADCDLECCGELPNGEVFQLSSLDLPRLQTLVFKERDFMASTFDAKRNHWSSQRLKSIEADIGTEERNAILKISSSAITIDVDQTPYSAAQCW